jgi:Ser/Thr protein kinase RdoA (MazF antagonist)
MHTTRTWCGVHDGNGRHGDLCASQNLAWPIASLGLERHAQAGERIADGHICRTPAELLKRALQARLVHMINLGVECSLSQLLETGVMHADPHPGNLILTPDNRLAYLDFGLLTFVPPQSSEVRLHLA